MKKEEIKKQVEQLLPYLESKKIEYAIYSHLDFRNFYLAKSGRLCCLITRTGNYVRTIRPGDKDYHPIFGGSECVEYDFSSNIMLYDTDGTIIIDLQEISSNGSYPPGFHFNNIDNSNNRRIFLDSENVLIPIKNNENKEVGCENNYQHFRIKDRKAILMHTFSPKQFGDGNLKCSDSLIRNNLIMFDTILYDFSTGNVLQHPSFSVILVPEDFNHSVDIKLWNCFKYLEREEIQELCKFISSEMDRGNAMFGYKEIYAKKESVEKKYYTFVYLDSKANIISDLFYSNGEELKSRKVTNETYDEVIDNLQSDLYTQIDITLNQRQKNRLQMIKKQLSPAKLTGGENNG